MLLLQGVNSCALACDAVCGRSRRAARELVRKRATKARQKQSGGLKGNVKWNPLCRAVADGVKRSVEAMPKIELI
eukprot:978896-Rhodomonas_salina.1